MRCRTSNEFVWRVSGVLFNSDSERHERVVRHHVDADGNEYEWNWVTNAWEPKQGLFGPQVNLDVFGNPHVDRNWVGDPVADVDWTGERRHSSDGDDLFLLTDDSSES
jgi:hypothetical protein